MTTAADDSAVEDAFEALLAGRPVPEGAAGLAAFTEAVRTSATRPGRPSAALADLLATGLLTDQSSPSARTARSAGSPPARSSRVRIRRRTAMIFPVLIAKFLSAGAIAQAATGAGVVVVAFTGIGAVGALPAPVQDTFATVVATVTPLEAPTSDETADEVVDETLEDVVTEPTEGTEPTEEGTETELTPEQKWAEEGPAAGQSFGAWVSEGAGHGWVNGKVVSDWAHKKHVEWDGETAPATPTAEPTEDAEVEDASETEVETDNRESKRGNGNGPSNGSGHGGGNGRN
jgi:hypothetical protein